MGVCVVEWERGLAGTQEDKSITRWGNQLIGQENQTCSGRTAPAEPGKIHDDGKGRG